MTEKVCAFNILRLKGEYSVDFFFKFALLFGIEQCVNFLAPAISNLCLLYGIFSYSPCFDCLFQFPPISISTDFKNILY